ncbi:MAG: Gfo/Idh/MocA family oxidoreductase [Ignavibacteriae bacterium]|nr:Gfo/Idh/MocA family oxidoreductase [Ignavibacteriota bacterium]
MNVLGNKNLKNPIYLNRKLKWGVAGCGKFAETTFIPTLLQLKKSSLVSIYSSDINRSKEIANKFFAKNYFDDYQEFLKQDFEILYIGSANNDHHWQVIQAAKAGKHIHCEKPLALSYKEAEEMVNVCEENNVFLSVNYVHRFHPLSVKAKEIIEKGMIGSIVSVSTTFNIDYEPDDNFRFDIEQSGGGAFRDLGTHMIDLLRFFGGEVLDITGFIDNVVYKSEVDDFAAAVLKYKKGGYGFLNVSYNSKHSFNRIEIIGSSGSLSIENIIGRKKKPGKLTIELAGEGRKAFRKRSNKLLVLLKSLQKSTLQNKPPSVSGIDGLINMQIMEKLESKCLK